MFIIILCAPYTLHTSIAAAGRVNSDACDEERDFFSRERWLWEIIVITDRLIDAKSLRLY